MKNDHLSRRDFIQRSGLVGAGIAAAQMLPLRFLQAQTVDDLANPLARYPNRDWEKLYRNQYAYDSAFSWVCAPNDTHNCRITAHVRNGVIVRLGEEFDIDTYSDIYGNKATANWGNRHCAKGYTFHRILYGPYRLKHPIVRRGWKRWADAGFPELTPEVKAKYLFDSRGTDKFERISWDEALAAEVAQLAAANERNRMAREIHDTLGHYLTVIHVQLEAARAVIGRDPERGLLAVTRAQALAKDGLTAVRQSVKALREEGSVDGIAEQIASLVDSVRDERFGVALTILGTPRPVSAAVALALHRTTLEALTNVRKHANAANVEIELAFSDNGLVQLRVHDDGKGAVEETVGTGFGLRGIRERAEQLKGHASYQMAPNEGFTLYVELPA